MDISSDKSIALQISEHAQLQQQLYEELSRTPEQGAVFTDMVKTVLERETAFVKWKSEGAAAYWEKTGPGPAVAASRKHTPDYTAGIRVAWMHTV